MKPFKFFLFYYSLIATTILLPISLFLLPKPQNIANTLLLTPVVFFFWTYVAKPDSSPSPKWSKRLLIVVSLLSLLGIFSYFLITRPLPSTTFSGTGLEDIKQYLTESNAEEKEFRKYLEEEISALRTKIDSLGNRDLNVIGVTAPTGTSTSPEESIGQITAKNPNPTSIAIYLDSSLESQAVGSAEYAVVYPFYEKSGDWYRIDQGWVEARWFTEIAP
jgi:hypothetical protein